MRTIMTIIMMCCISAAAMAQNAVSNVRTRQHKEMLYIMYDLETKADIETYVSFDDGETYTGPLQHVTGAVGEEVYPEKEKIIAWNVVKEVGYVNQPNVLLKIVNYPDNSFSDETEHRLVLTAVGKKVYTDEGTKLSKYEVRKIMGDNLYALTLYDRGRATNPTGNLVTIVGSLGIASVYGNVFGGGPMILATGIMSKPYPKIDIKESVNMYNAYPDYTPEGLYISRFNHIYRFHEANVIKSDPRKGSVYMYNDSDRLISYKVRDSILCRNNALNFQKRGESLNKWGNRLIIGGASLAAVGGGVMLLGGNTMNRAWDKTYDSNYNQWINDRTDYDQRRRGEKIWDAGSVPLAIGSTMLITGGVLKLTGKWDIKKSEWELMSDNNSTCYLFNRNKALNILGSNLMIGGVSIAASGLGMMLLSEITPAAPKYYDNDSRRWVHDYDYHRWTYNYGYHRYRNNNLFDTGVGTLISGGVVFVTGGALKIASIWHPSQKYETQELVENNNSVSYLYYKGPLNRLGNDLLLSGLWVGAVGSLGHLADDGLAYGAYFTGSAMFLTGGILKIANIWSPVKKSQARDLMKNNNDALYSYNRGESLNRWGNGLLLSGLWVGAVGSMGDIVFDGSGYVALGSWIAGGYIMITGGFLKLASIKPIKNSVNHYNNSPKTETAMDLKFDFTGNGMKMTLKF